LFKGKRQSCNGIAFLVQPRMEKSACYFLGTVIKLHGYLGELTVFLDVDKPDNYRKLESVLIEINSDLVPFFIQHLSFKNNAVIMKLEDVNTLEQAEVLVGQSLYLPLERLPPLSGKKFYFHEVINFEVIDKTEGSLGVVDKILDLPKQAVIQIMHKGKEVLIPISDEIIIAVDREKKQLHIEMPEGLLAIYM
jgi:16S rRNA processing protein RimM